MNGKNPHQEAVKRHRWVEKGALYTTAAPFYTRITTCGGGSSGATAMLAPPPPLAPTPRRLLGLSAMDADVASTVVPPVTVVLEGSSICHRIHLTRHANYQSFAAALHRMFVDMDGDDENGEHRMDGLDLSNAVPGHMVAYEDVEDDLLLAGDLSWKDFVRVAKRIRIIPAKASPRKHCGGA